MLLLWNKEDNIQFVRVREVDLDGIVSLGLYQSFFFERISVVFVVCNLIQIAILVVRDNLSVVDAFLAILESIYQR